MSTFFSGKEEEKFYYVSYDPELSASKNPIQLKTFDRKGAPVVICKKNLNGSFAFTEVNVCVLKDGTKGLLPINGFHRTSGKHYSREYKIEADKPYSWVILENKDFSIEHRHRFISPKIGEFKEYTKGKNPEVGEGSSPLQIRLVIANNHYFGAEKAEQVIAAGDIVFDQNGNVTSINNKAGGYFVRSEDPDFNKKVESQKRAVTAVGIKPELFKPYEKPATSPGLTQTNQTSSS